MAALMFCGMLGAVIADWFRRRSEAAHPENVRPAVAGSKVARP
jgi:hypothetical protein